MSKSMILSILLTITSGAFATNSNRVLEFISSEREIIDGKELILPEIEAVPRGSNLNMYYLPGQNDCSLNIQNMTGETEIDSMEVEVSFDSGISIDLYLNSQSDRSFNVTSSTYKQALPEEIGVLTRRESNQEFNRIYTYAIDQIKSNSRIARDDSRSAFEQGDALVAISELRNQYDQEFEMAKYTEYKTGLGALTSKKSVSVILVRADGPYRLLRSTKEYTAIVNLKGIAGNKTCAFEIDSI